MAKYELTTTSKVLNGHIVYRIKSLSTFGSVAVGDFGGWVESESNLSQVGDCWIYDDAACYGSAQVYGNASLLTNVEVYENAQVFDDAFVMDNIKIHGYSQVYEWSFLYGNVEIYENAQVYGLSWVYDYAKIYGYSQVYGDSLVYDNARVYDYGQVYDYGKVYGYAQIYGNGLVDSTAQVYGNARVYDTAWITEQSRVYGFAWVFGTSEIKSNAIVRECSKVENQIVGLDEIIETSCGYSIIVSADTTDINFSILNVTPEFSIPVSSTNLRLFTPAYEEVLTPMFHDYKGQNHSMGTGTNLRHGYITKCSHTYDNERRLFDYFLVESYNHHGVCLTYYIASYNKNYDKVWGEDNYRFFERKFNFMAFYSLPREEKMWSKFGIQGMDSFSMFSSKLHFRDASTFGFNSVKGNIGQGTYPTYIPQMGDVIRSKYNNHLYEIVEVKEEIGMYLLSKQHVWEFIVRPYKDEHISLSATTSTSMNEISAYTNKSSDIFNISNVIDTKKVPIKYLPKPGEKSSGDVFAGW